MYYLKRNKTILKELPSCYEKCSESELEIRGALPFIDNGKTKELPVKGKIEAVDGVFVQQYVSNESFDTMKASKCSQLSTRYESRIDLAVRKATQDIAFGEAKEIPKKVIKKRSVLKAAYHAKAALIEGAVSVEELNSIAL